MAEKVTVMVLKVDLQCSCCYKNIKKILCKFPQIKDQMYDDKQNQVIITVVCCSPEKFRDKLCCKGRKVIKSIDIKEPPKCTPIEQMEKETKQQEHKEEDSKQQEHKEEESKQQEHKEEESKQQGQQKAGLEPAPHPCPLIHVEVRCPPYPGRGCCGPCSEGYPGGPCYHEHERPTLPPSLLPYPGRGCCGPCSEGNPGGPCYQEHERPTLSLPQRSYEGYGYEYGYGYRYDGGKGCRVSRCDYYFSEENPQGCTIM